MKDIIINVLVAVVIPPFSSWSSHVAFRSSRDAFYCGWILSALFGVVGLSIQHYWVWAGIAGVNMLIAVYLWWRKRNKRKRAPRAYGAKSRALVTALIRRAREHARPRPVLRPLPNPG